MNLYLISQSEVIGWDTYDSAVVAAETDVEAKNTHPYSTFKGLAESNTWTNDPDKVTAKLIGKAVKGTEAGVICASFNAG